jgi:peptidoglycan/LPS O-acetylase OafA/YrhL
MKSSSSPPAAFRRADIQGLRAIAVLLVVADHLSGKPSGGFIGVDIFFVISGYLITGLLPREYLRTSPTFPGIVSNGLCRPRHEARHERTLAGQRPL